MARPARAITATTYVEGPFCTVEEARLARLRYAGILRERGLAPRYGVRVAMIPGSLPPMLAVWVVEHEPPSHSPTDTTDTTTEEPT